MRLFDHYHSADELRMTQSNAQLGPCFRPDGCGRARGRAWRRIGRGGLLVVIYALTVLPGCNLIHRQPVEDNVAAARDLSFRGLHAMQHDDWSTAEVLFGRAVQACPEDERAQQRYAQALWRRGVQESAVRHMTEAVRLSGGDPELRVELGEMYLATDKLPLATQQADEAIRGNRQLAAAWALHGHIARRSDNYVEALGYYHRALSFQDNFPEVQMAVADLYYRQNRPERMLATLDALVDQYPQQRVPQDVLYLKGIALKSLDRFREAAETLVAASGQAEPSAELLFHLGEAQNLAGDLSAARRTIVAALAKNPNHRESLRLQAEIETLQRGMTAAVQPTNR